VSFERGEGHLAAFRYDPKDLAGERPAGISGYLRIRNGEDWLEEAVRSHEPFFDEIVAVHEGCTDRTPEILEGLKSEFSGKLRVYRYEPEVYPVGSELHKRTPSNSVHSIANYYNYALAKTRYRIATKLDDDHIAIPPVWERLRRELALRDFRLGKEMWCFSGVNLVARGHDCAAHSKVPFAGNGDHWLSEVAPGRDFGKDWRFERFRRRGLRIRYCGIAYWHLKYMKRDQGFANYQLDKNPKSRYHKQLRRFEMGKEGVSLIELEERCSRRSGKRGLSWRLLAACSAKKRLKLQREAEFSATAIEPYLPVF